MTHEDAILLTRERIMNMPLLISQIVTGQYTERPKGGNVRLPIDGLLANGDLNNRESPIGSGDDRGLAPDLYCSAGDGSFGTGVQNLPADGDC